MQLSCASCMGKENRSPGVQLAQMVEPEIGAEAVHALDPAAQRQRTPDAHDPGQDAQGEQPSAAEPMEDSGEEADSDSDTVSTESSGQGIDEDLDTVWEPSSASSSDDDLHDSGKVSCLQRDECIVGEAYAYKKLTQHMGNSIVQSEQHVGRGTEDWKFDSSKFAEYDMTFGPFDVDACADDSGENAHLLCHWSPSNSCLKNSWTGLTVFCNPPWSLIHDVLKHFLHCRTQSPHDTHAVFVLPNWPWQAWYPLAMQHFTVVDYFPTGSQLFTAPSHAAGERVVRGPTRWPVFVLKDSDNRAGDGQDWASKFRPPIGKAADALQEMPNFKEVTSWRLGSKLTETMQQQLQQLMNERPEIWAWTEDQIGRTKVTAHSIDTGDAKPLKQRAYRLAAAEDEVVATQVSKWLRLGIVVPSQSPWASPVVLVKKKPLNADDPAEKPKFRLCVDFRKVNALTKTDSFPLPIIQDALDVLGDAKHFSIVDLRSAFLQLPLHPNDREKTAFVTKQGLYEFTVLPFGLKNSPSIFQRLMHQVLEGLLGQICMVFLDDIVIFSSTWEEHLQHLREVFARLHEHNLSVHPDKSVIGADELKYLGHIISSEGNLPDPEKLAAVATIQPPDNVTDLRAFLGLVGYYRRFIPQFARLAAPLHHLLKKDQIGTWTEDCQLAFESLKDKLLQPPLLRRPSLHDPYVLQTDWSLQAVAAVLCQVQEGKEHPIAYASKAMTPAEKNYSATEGECLAVVWACKHFRQYLYGRSFVLQTDHSALRWLMETKDLTGRLARWSLKLQEFTFEVRYRPGAANANADALSRLPVISSAVLQNDSHVTIHLCTSQLRDDVNAPTPKRPRRDAVKEGGGATAEISRHQEPSSDQVPRRDQDRGGSSASGALFVDGQPAAKSTAQPAEGSEHTGESDSRSESVEIAMPCEVCSQPTQDSEMLVCESCNRGFHLFCLRPRLHQVPDEAWFCGDCGGDSQTSHTVKDITLDGAVLYCLKHGAASTKLHSIDQKRAKKRAVNYTLDARGRLFRKATKQYPDRWVPKLDQRTDIIADCHKFGHWGVLRTASMVAERYYWGGIVQDCKAYVRNCQVCKLEHAHFSQPQALQSIPVTDQSFQRVGIDLVGPLPVSSAGNKYIVVAMDYLSKWPEAVALPDKKASTVKQFFMRDVIARHGCPKEVLSDNGSEFFGEFDELLQEFKIDHRLTSPNHPQANGLVEWFNGTLVTALRKCAATHIGDWDLEIPSVLLGYRSSVQASTKYSPFFMLYARMPLLPVGPAVASLDLKERTVEQAADQLLNKATALQEAKKKAVQNIAVAQEKHKRDYKAKRKYVEPTSLKAGDMVVIKASKRKDKLTPGAGPDVFKLVRFTNAEKTNVVLTDASEPPKLWRENVGNIALYATTAEDWEL